MKVKYELKGLMQSFRYAGQGFLYCINNERNMRIHLSAFVILSVFSQDYGLNRLEYLLFAIVCGLVIFAEMVNTSVEAIIDLVAPSYRPLAKIAKDVAAAAVLLTAMLAVLVGIGLYGDLGRLHQALLYILHQPFRLALYPAMLLLAFLFVFYGGGIISKMDAGRKK